MGNHTGEAVGRHRTQPADVTVSHGRKWQCIRPRLKARLLLQGRLPNIRDLQVASRPMSAKAICHARQRDLDLDWS